MTFPRLKYKNAEVVIQKLMSGICLMAGLSFVLWKGRIHFLDVASFGLWGIYLFIYYSKSVVFMPRAAQRDVWIGVHGESDL